MYTIIAIVATKQIKNERTILNSFGKEYFREMNDSTSSQ